MSTGNDRPESPNDARIDSRADLLPEEQAAGSDDPHAQAEAILEESDERTDDPEGTQHESSQTPDDRRASAPDGGSPTRPPPPLRSDRRLPMSTTCG